MQIILLPGLAGRARSLFLTRRQGLLIIAGGLLVLVALVCAASAICLRYVLHADSGWGRAVVARFQAEETERSRSYLHESLNAMATKLGQMQAQLMRIDALGERLSRSAGFKPQEFLFDRPPGQGGPVPASTSRSLSLDDLGSQLDRLGAHIEDRSDKLLVLESTLTQASAARKFLPTQAPVPGSFRSSDFGWRIDPFTGENVFHEGVDITAQEGLPILAAAGGVVVFAGLHPQYGNMVEVDHGNELLTRYGHAARLLVKVGDIVQRGSKIAEVGNTGRSTGAHLHFEVRLKGAAQNPARFLRSPG